MNAKSKNLFLGVFYGVALGILSILGYYFTPDSGMVHRIFEVMGGRMPYGIIQILTYISFFWGMLEIYNKLNNIQFQTQAFHIDLLPEKDHLVLSPDEIGQLKIETAELEKKYNLFLIRVVKNACTKFGFNQSISEVIEMVKSQIKIHQTNAESQQSTIRYLAWVIPSIGFIGTVLGISQALGIAGDPDTTKITDILGVAFDTTLVALILSIILMWFFHQLQEKEEKIYNDMESYVMENLVNRIDLK